MGRRIEIHTSPAFEGLDAEIPGAYWSARKGRWSLPLNMACCRNIRQVFGSGLEIGPRLTAWALEEIKQERSQRRLGRSLAAVPLPGVEARAPRLAQALLSRPYQSPAAAFLASGRNVINADTPGLGKTTETIAGIIESGVRGPYLVAAPVSTLSDAWERELLARLGDGARVFVITGNKSQRESKLDEALWPDVVDGEPMGVTEEKLVCLDWTWVIINIEMLRTKVWWVCPHCEESNVRVRAERQALKPAWEEAMAEYEILLEEHLLDPDAGEEPVKPLEPKFVPRQERWEASDRPKSSIVDCGHSPRDVRTEKEYQYPELFDRTWGAIVMDECQRILLKNNGKPTQTRNGAMLLESDENGLRAALSGTPMRGKPMRLWGVLNWLDRARFSGKWAWIERFWDVDTSGYGGARVIGRFRENRREAWEADLDRYMIRRTKQEVSPGLPLKAYMGTPLDPRDPGSPVAVWIPMYDKQKRAYDQMLTLSTADLDETRLNAVGLLAQMTRLKQFASTYGRMETVKRRITGEREASQRAYRKARGAPDLLDELWEEIDVFRPEFPSNKWDWLEQWLRERNLLDSEDVDEEPDTAVVIVSQFTSILDLISAKLVELKGKHCKVTGAVTGLFRQRAVDMFNDPDSGVNILLLNTTAGGVGLTLDAGEDMVFLDETHVPDDQEQAEGRIDNRRPEVRVVQRRYWYLKTRLTIDEAIARKNLDKDADQKHHLDGRRGVEYAREVFATMKELADRGRK